MHKIFVCVLVLMAIAHFAVAAGTAGAASPPVTFNKDIAPIIYENCTTCHRPGEVAPFPLITFHDVRRHATEIGDLTKSRAMPPWKAEDGFGQFAHVRRLSQPQIDLIGQWIQQGKREGEVADLPPAPHFPDGWRLGEPDLVLQMPEAFTLRAEGPDVFRCFVIPLNLTQDQYVKAVDFRPGNRKIVHHALFFLDTSGRARELDAADPGPGYSRSGGPGFRPSGGLGGWAPGVIPRLLPEGVALPLATGSDLVVQTHFHPSGKVEHEQSTIGIYLAKKPPEKLLISIPHGYNRIDIPAGEKNYVIDNTFTVPGNVELEGIFPHAHLLCRQVKVTATLPGGEELPLIWIKDWDWSWQGQYQYAHPLQIPAGTKVRMQFTYDNTSDNIHNPNNPPKRVHFGEQTGDEMALVFYDILIDRRAADGLLSLRQRFGRNRLAATTQPAREKE